MKAIGFAITCLLLSFFILLSDTNFTNILLEPKAHDATKQLTYHFAGIQPIPEDFNEQEKSHLQDVTWLIRMLFIILLILLLIIPKTIKSAKKGTLILIIITISAALLPFELLFEYFHKILFPQGNYTFSFDSTLIQYYPQTFFANYAISIMILSIIIGTIIFLISKNSKINKTAKL